MILITSKEYINKMSMDSDKYKQELKIEERYLENIENIIQKVFIIMFYSIISGIGLALGFILTTKFFQSLGIYI